MEELEGALQALLQSPDTMQKLQAVLGGAAASAPPKPSAPSDAAALQALLGSLGGETEDTALLRALRPYLHGEREKRLDHAIQMMRVAQILPLLQQDTKGE